MTRGGKKTKHFAPCDKHLWIIYKQWILNNTLKLWHKWINRNQPFILSMKFFFLHWARQNRGFLYIHELWGVGSTCRLVGIGGLLNFLKQWGKQDYKLGEGICASPIPMTIHQARHFVFTLSKKEWFWIRNSFTRSK